MLNSTTDNNENRCQTLRSKLLNQVEEKRKATSRKKDIFNIVFCEGFENLK